MIKYFDFEYEIEKIDNLIESLKKNIDVNNNKIEKLKSEKKNY